MTIDQRLKNLSVPKGKIDVVLDTDAYNEIDDQFAIAYMLKSKDKLNVKAIYAAPFFNDRSQGPEDGMLRSYDEILKLLSFMDEKLDVFEGSRGFLQNETTPIVSPAAEDLVKKAMDYSPQNPLYVVAIGAITNVASALLLEPSISENIVIVWLGGHGHHIRQNAHEFNMRGDYAAARVVMRSGTPFVQLPCLGVVSSFTISKPELEYWLKGKNSLATYLAENTVEEAEKYASGRPWTRVIWDVTAVAWLLNDGERFMQSRIVPTPIPTYEGFYSFDQNGLPMQYVYYIKRDALMTDLIKKLTE